MRPYHFRNGWVLILGDRYDLRKALDAAEAVIDCLSRHLGPQSSVVSTELPGYRRDLVWPTPARELARDTWIKAAREFDVSDISLSHRIGPLTVKVFLLGKTWCVYDRDTGRLTTPGLRPVSDLDPTPTICLYGPETQPGCYGLLEPAVLDAVETALRTDLGDLGLQMERHVLTPDPTRPESTLQVAFLTLPHAVYGNGRGPIRVRCVTPSGGEVRPTPAN